MLKNILVIANTYPTKVSPNFGAFVYNLMQELGKIHDVTIISAFKIHQIFNKKHNTYGEEICQVKRPLWFSLGNRNFLGIKSGTVTSYLYKRAVVGAVKRLENKHDVVYAHFLVNAIPLLDYVAKNEIPLIIASGESTYDSWDSYSLESRTQLIKLTSHIICVSRENKEQLIALGFSKSKISIVPNAVNYELFRPLNKENCRKNIGVANDKFTVGFIGHFIERKGPNRVIEAIKSLNDPDIQLICVGGKGELQPNDFTTKLDPMPNYKLPEIYNAFDVFVLPTLHEGHCNAIEEAKACGVPIISSKGTSVEEQVTKEFGFLVDPLSIIEISTAISTLKENSILLQQMANSLINKRGENSLGERANKISKIIETHSSN